MIGMLLKHVGLLKLKAVHCDMAFIQTIQPHFSEFLNGRLGIVSTAFVMISCVGRLRKQMVLDHE